MKVYLDLTSPEYHETSAMPKILRHILYHNSTLVNLIENTGCPNTGCQHKLIIKGEHTEVFAWLDLLVELYYDVTPEVMVIKHRIRDAVLSGKEINGNGYFTVKLNQITRMVPIDGGIVPRPWFWSPSWEEN